jgi:hypothetical protein
MKDELFSFPHSYLHYNPVVLLSHLKLEELEIENPIDSIYGECSHALHASTMGIYDEDRFEYLEKCVVYLKENYLEYDWVWNEEWDGRTIHLVADILHEICEKHSIDESKIHFYVSNLNKNAHKHGFNYHISLTIMGAYYVGDATHSIFVEPNETHSYKYFLQGGRNTINRTNLFNELSSSGFINDDMNHTISLTSGQNGGDMKYTPTEMYDILKESFMTVVCESESTNSENLTNNLVTVLSEKVGIAVSSFKPFVVFGDASYIPYLTEIGFRTFDTWWDESYDSETTMEGKIEKIIQIIDSIYQKTPEELNTILSEMRETLVHNHNLFMEIVSNPIVYSTN